MSDIGFENAAPIQNQAGHQIINGNVIFNGGVGAPHKRSRFGYEQEVISSLAFPQMFDRRRKIDPAHNQTCRWIDDLDEYRKWRAAPRGLLWIKGKPGSGKSTMMSHLYSSICAQDGPPDTRLEFFFSARGAPLQHEPLGMFRALLSQLFHRDHAIRDVLRKLYQDTFEPFGSPEPNREWQLPELKTVFKDMVSSSAQTRQIIIFLDALDEAGEQAARDIAHYFHVLNDLIEDQQGSIRICISCRHYPVPSNTRTTEVHMERHNRQDIKAFVEDYLQLNKMPPKLKRYQPEWQKISEYLVDMAYGVFQWVILVVPMITKWIGDGDTPDEIREKLEKVPDGLKGVYRHIIEHVIDDRHRPKSLRLFQWVGLAAYPLSFRELRYAMAAFDQETSRSKIPYDGRGAVIDGKRISISHIMSWSGGLVEVVKSANKGPSIIQVIHQSVCDYLLEDGLSFLVNLNSHVDIHGPVRSLSDRAHESIQISHGALYVSCLKFLSTACVTPPLDRMRCKHNTYCRRCRVKWMDLNTGRLFRRYAANYGLIHAEKSMGRRGIDPEDESRLIAQALPSSITDRVLSFHGGATVLHVASAVGLEDLVCYRLSCGDDHLAEDELGWTAFHFATARGHLNIVQRLFRAGVDLEMVTRSGEAALELAAREGHADVFAWLIAQGAVFDTSDREFFLFLAVSNLRLSISQICLVAHADVDTMFGDRGTALQIAARENGKEMVQMLLDAGADVNAGGGIYGGALQAAAYNWSSDEEVIRVLLQAGADVNARAEGSDTALHGAACTGSVEKVRLLLKAGADVDAHEKERHTPLESAASEGHRDIVKLLLGAGANVNICGYSGTALVAAAHRGRESIVQLLLDVGADVNARGGKYGNALVAAATEGHSGIVDQLLDAGADVDLADEVQGTALQVAAYLDDPYLVRLLLNAGADVNVQGGEYGNALQAAACNWRSDDTTVVKRLLEAGADVNAAGGKYGNALAAALTQGNFHIAAALWHAGAAVPDTWVQSSSEDEDDQDDNDNDNDNDGEDVYFSASRTEDVRGSRMSLDSQPEGHCDSMEIDSVAVDTNSDHYHAPTDADVAEDGWLLGILSRFFPWG